MSSPLFYSPLAPKLQDNLDPAFKYAATLFQRTINILGAIPTNEPGDNYVQYFNLSPTLVLGRRVAHKIISTIGKNKSRFVSEERDEIIFDAALGIEIGAGVCDTYAAVVSFLSLSTPGPIPGKTVYVSQSGGHTVAFVYNIKIDAHNEIVFNEITRRNFSGMSSLVDLTNISQSQLQKKYDAFSHIARLEIEKMYESLSEDEKLAFLEFKKIKDPGGIGSLESRAKVAVFLQKKRIATFELRKAKKQYKKALKSGNAEALNSAEIHLQNAEREHLINLFFPKLR